LVQLSITDVACLIPPDLAFVCLFFFSFLAGYGLLSRLSLAPRITNGAGSQLVCCARGRVVPLVTSIPRLRFPGRHSGHPKHWAWAPIYNYYRCPPDFLVICARAPRTDKSTGQLDPLTHLLTLDRSLLHHLFFPTSWFVSGWLTKGIMAERSFRSPAAPGPPMNNPWSRRCARMTD